MRNLIHFIIKHNFFFLFLIFEVISVTLYINNSYYQQAQLFSISQEISGNVYRIKDNITRYFSLTNTNRELAENNAKLLNMTIRSFTRIDTTTVIIKDTIYKQQYKYFYAKVVNNSINKKNNYLTLDKGSNEGIGKDMAVITANGLVGIVKSVSPNFSSVISILNSKTKISGKIKKNNYVGSIVWEGNDYKVGILKDIPSHVRLFKGDTIVTSGYSNIFPEGLPVGTIQYYKKEEGENFYTIYFRFTNDMDRLGYVYIINYLHKDEQQLIEKETQND
jgi:rod shape-determining protein MreC